MPRPLLFAPLLFFLLLTFAARSFADDLQSRTLALAANYPDRSAASSAAAKDADLIAAQLAVITHAPVYRQPFLLVLPTVETCTALDQTPGTKNANIPISPLLPSGGQPAALRPDQSTADLLYLGDGTLEELRGKNLAGRFIALNLASKPLAWQTAASLGARAIIFLADSRVTTPDLLDKSTSLPVGIPRFYCDDPPSVTRIKAGEIRSLKIDVRIRWQEKRLENIACFLPGSIGPQQYIILQARYDASSEVMGRAPGATQAASAAALLILAEKLAAAPVHASVLLLFTAGDEWNFRGTRAALDLVNPEFKDFPKALADLQNQVDQARSRRDTATALNSAVIQIAAGNFAALASADARTAVEDQLLRQSELLEEQLQHARFAAAPDAPLLASLQSQKDDLLAATGALTPAASRAALQKSHIQSAAADLLPTLQRDVQRLTSLHDALAAWPTIRRQIGPRTPMLFLSLALTSGSPRYGFFARSDYDPDLDFTGKAFAQAFRRYAPPTPPPGQIIHAGFMPDSTEKRFTLESFFSLHVAFSSDAALARGIPAGAFSTVQDATGVLDTPADTADRLDFPNLLLQEQSLAALLVNGDNGALTDPAFYLRNELANLTADQDVTLFERSVGESLPRLKAADCLLGGEAENDGQPLGPPLAGTRRQDWYLTHADGTATFTSALRNARTRLTALQFDDHGFVTHALAGNLADLRGLADDFSPDPDRPIRCMLFQARRLDCYRLFDPRYLDTLDKIDVLDARRLDKAQFSNVYAKDAIAAVFLPPDIRWQLLLARGALNNRMLLINASPDNPSGIGFDTTDLEKLGPLPWRNVLDLDALNEKRRHDLEKFGIASQVIKELSAAAAAQIDRAKEAENSRDYPAFFAASSAAWSLESQVYQTLIDTSDGIIKGVIFLLLGIIPFSYFLERLIIGAATIYRQIVGFAVIFAVMTGALWFHPAFRISSAPLMILLAFLILILSSAVVYILWGKFEEEIARIRGSGAAGAAHSTSLRRGAVLGAAVRLGLSNMRRRGTRTALTLLTLVLLTFTLLCFTSVTESVQVTPRLIKFPADIPPLPPGILLRQRAWQTLPPQTLALAAGIAHASQTLAPRYSFGSQKSEEPWMIPLRKSAPAASDNSSPIAQSAPGGTFYASALLGLTPEEAAFQSVPIDSVLPRFSALAEHPDLCWLPIEAQGADFSVGDSIDILGHRLTVAGFYSDASFRKLRQLTADPLSPIDPSGAPKGATALTTDPQQLTAAPEASYRFLAPGNIAIVPAALLEKIGGRLTSVMLRPPGPVFPAAEALARQSAFTIYASDGSRVRSINAAMSSEPRDFGAVLIPMLIAGVIILNTMLGAVSERTREIHVYTSIGLAPSHVAMLFLAEAAALGTIGVVSGYIFGQGLATVLSYTHLLPGVDLNYSSLSAIVTMGLVLGLVMLSALWPARAASRLAAPSLDRKWKLPKPIGDVLYVELPFTVNETAAKGIVAFLEEFFITTTQTGGRFTADHIHAFTQSANIAPAPTRGLAAKIWLAPYDLGVIQNIRLAIHPTPEPNIFDVHLELTREAGNPATWRRLNRPFLVEIRKQFLLWRNLTPEQLAHYLERSATLFAPPP